MGKPDFVVWAAGDAHVDCDLKRGRRSLHDTLRQSENGGELGGPAFDWDIMLDVGDLASAYGCPGDTVGREVVSQYAALKTHKREQVYNLMGNHDASPAAGAGENEWFRKWVDPLGENPEFSGVHAEQRPFPVHGTYERYSFQAGNVLFLMMSDRNDLPAPIGKAGAEGGGGFPAGAVSGETFDWWVDQVESNQDKIIVSAHHHVLKETTVASGPWEGFQPQVDRYGNRRHKYHGFYRNGAPMGASYLYWVNGNPDAQAFERYLADRPGAIDLWLGGHTHTHPDDTCGDRSHIEQKWGATFMNVAGLGLHCTNGEPMSRLLTFTENSPELEVRCYLHTSHHAPQGWYDAAQRTVSLRAPFHW